MPRARIFQGVLVLLGVAAAVAVRLQLGDVLEPRRALELLRQVQHHPWIVPLFVATYAAATLGLVPAMLFHVAAGVAWGFAQGTLLCLLALNVSASLQFWLARRAGRETVRALLAKSRWQRLVELPAADSVGAMAAIRYLPLPHALVNLSVGVSSVRWRTFALGSALGTLPILLTHTYCAALIVEGAAGFSRNLGLSLLLAGLLIVGTWTLSRVVASRRRARTSS